MDKEDLRQLEQIRKRLGFKSRSKMLRNAISSLLKENEKLDSLKGHVETVFVLTYRESEKNHVSDLIHRFEDIIKTTLHQHNHSGTCIDIMNLDTDASKTRDFFNTVKKSKCVYSVAYAVVQEGRQSS